MATRWFDADLFDDLAIIITDDQRGWTAVLCDHLLEIQLRGSHVGCAFGRAVFEDLSYLALEKFERDNALCVEVREYLKILVLLSFQDEAFQFGIARITLGIDASAWLSHCSSL